MASLDDNEYEIPLQDQSVFGAGMRRKNIVFVPAAKPKQHCIPESPTHGTGDRYLSIVLNRASGSSDGPVQHVQQEAATTTSNLGGRFDGSICEICRLPISSSHHQDARVESSKHHETSLAHQVCLEHSHPPSHLDRTRQGLQYLSSYGWDPDARLGLGASGTGIRVPIKAKPKNDTMGLGLLAPSPLSRVSKPPLKKLDAKQTRKAEEKAQKDRRKLQSLFYQKEDVEKFLGSSG
ncbi:MAG: hypothetical protein L6R40_004166 [Gallowayella cf. fulva]|nr:MAG: hypothetical protein L6R40_004166 [Xanthomendoza cf. fulva]